jgi:rubrerythrin
MVKNKKRVPENIRQAIKEYGDSELSQNEIAIKYGITRNCLRYYIDKSKAETKRITPKENDSNAEYTAPKPSHEAYIEVKQKSKQPQKTYKGKLPIREENQTDDKVRIQFVDQYAELEKLKQRRNMQKKILAG